VAWLFYRDSPWSRKAQVLSAYALTAIGIALFVVAMWDLKSTGSKGLIYTSLLHTSSAALFTGCLIPAIEGYKGAVGRFLSFGPLCWLGKISYGCYLYHVLIRNAVDSISRRTSIDLPTAIDFSVKTLLTFLVAWLSWTVLETRVNLLKRHFPMRVEEARS